MRYCIFTRDAGVVDGHLIEEESTNSGIEERRRPCTVLLSMTDPKLYYYGIWLKSIAFREEKFVRTSVQ